MITFFTINGRGLEARRGTIGSGKGGQDPTVLVFGVFRSNPIVGTMDGSLYLFDSNRQLSRVVDAHNGPVTAMYSSSEGLITGGKDGQVIWWNTTL